MTLIIPEFTPQDLIYYKVGRGNVNDHIDVVILLSIAAYYPIVPIDPNTKLSEVTLDFVVDHCIKVFDHIKNNLYPSDTDKYAATEIFNLDYSMIFDIFVSNYSQDFVTSFIKRRNVIGTMLAFLRYKNLGAKHIIFSLAEFKDDNVVKWLTDIMDDDTFGVKRQIIDTIIQKDDPAYCSYAKFITEEDVRKYIDYYYKCGKHYYVTVRNIVLREYLCEIGLFEPMLNGDSNVLVSRVIANHPYTMGDFQNHYYKSKDSSFYLDNIFKEYENSQCNVAKAILIFVRNFNFLAPDIIHKRVQDIERELRRNFSNTLKKMFISQLESDRNINELKYLLITDFIFLGKECHNNSVDIFASIADSGNVTALKISFASGNVFPKDMTKWMVSGFSKASNTIALEGLVEQLISQGPAFSHQYELNISILKKFICHVINQNDLETGRMYRNVLKKPCFNGSFSGEEVD